MSNFDKASNLASAWVESMGGLGNISYLYDDDVSGLMQAIHDADLLMPDLRVIRTVEELEAVCSAAWLMHFGNEPDDPVVMIQEDWVHDYDIYLEGIFPLVVMMDGDQVHAAREAMEIDNE